MVEPEGRLPKEIEVARRTAEILVKTDAVTVNTENGFVWSSGIKSPIYTDCRALLAHPLERREVGRLLADEIGLGNSDVVAGVAEGAISIATLAAEELDLPFIYARTEPKGHGKQKRVEGKLKPGQRVVVVEDVISSGASAIGAAQAVRDAGGIVRSVFSIMTYNLEESRRNFQENELINKSLTDIKTVYEAFAQARIMSEKGKIEKEIAEEASLIRLWLTDPKAWRPRAERTPDQNY